MLGVVRVLVMGEVCDGSGVVVGVVRGGENGSRGD